MRFDMTELRALQAAHLLSLVPDPESDLLIANYLPAAQYGKEWDAHPVLLDCRGIIIRPDGTVHAKPFRKFGNPGEFPGTSLEELAARGAPEVAHKMDGCFNRNTRLSLWDGGTVVIGEVVAKKLTPILIGMDERGKLIPAQVIGHLASKRKPVWMHIHLDRPLRVDGRGATYPTAMWVTPNHHIWVNGTCSPIGSAQVGDKLTGHERRPSPSVLHALESGLLGDGSITRNGAHYRYQEPHKIAHREYIEDVTRCLGPMAARAITTISGHGTPLVWVSSRNHRVCDELRMKWYPNGKKEVPDDLSWLDDYAVARWFMDDGSLSHHPAQQDRALFATNGFSQDAVIRLAERLSEMYGAFCTVYQSKGWCLRINAGRGGQIDRFWQAIAPHIVPCMRYKLPERYRSWSYIPYPDGSMSYEPVDVTIIGIRFVNAEDMGDGLNCGFDVQTSTGNYLAQGVLVHNSLIVSFRDPNTGAIRFSTRGSFTSDQAKHAARIWAERYSQVRIPSGCTYLFELIAPYNRIVVSYQEEDLVLTGVVRTETGYELPYSDVQSAAAYGALSYGMLRSVATEDIDWRSLHTVERPNFEGFVLYWPGDGLRVKVKLAEYVRLHRLVTGLSEHSIWEALHRGGALELRREIPEELWSWFDTVAAGLVGPFSRHASAVDDLYADILRKGLNPADRAQRKEIAAHINGHVHADLRGAAFACIDGKDWHTPIWRLLEPKGNQVTTTPIAARAEAS